MMHTHPQTQSSSNLILNTAACAVPTLAFAALENISLLDPSGAGLLLSAGVNSLTLSAIDKILDKAGIESKILRLACIVASLAISTLALPYLLIASGATMATLSLKMALSLGAIQFALKITSQIATQFAFNKPAKIESLPHPYLEKKPILTLNDDGTEKAKQKGKWFEKIKIPEMNWKNVAIVGGIGLGAIALGYYALSETLSEIGEIPTPVPVPTPSPEGYSRLWIGVGSLAGLLAIAGGVGCVWQKCLERNLYPDFDLNLGPLEGTRPSFPNINVNLLNSDRIEPMKVQKYSKSGKYKVFLKNLNSKEKYVFNAKYWTRPEEKQASDWFLEDLNKLQTPPINGKIELSDRFIKTLLEEEAKFDESSQLFYQIDEENGFKIPRISNSNAPKLYRLNVIQHKSSNKNITVFTINNEELEKLRSIFKEDLQLSPGSFPSIEKEPEMIKEALNNIENKNLIDLKNGVYDDISNVENENPEFVLVNKEPNQNFKSLLKQHPSPTSNKKKTVTFAKKKKNSNQDFQHPFPQKTPSIDLNKMEQITDSNNNNNNNNQILAQYLAPVKPEENLKINPPILETSINEFNETKKAVTDEEKLIDWEPTANNLTQKDLSYLSYGYNFFAEKVGLSKSYLPLSNSIVKTYLEYLRLEKRNFEFIGDFLFPPSSKLKNLPEQPPEKLTFIPLVLPSTYDHIVLVIIDPTQKTIEYYDSKGTKVENESRKIKGSEITPNDIVTKLSELHNKTYSILSNTNSHQSYSDVSRCGDYVIHFIEERVRKAIDAPLGIEMNIDSFKRAKNHIQTNSPLNYETLRILCESLVHENDIDLYTDLIDPAKNIEEFEGKLGKMIAQTQNLRRSAVIPYLQKNNELAWMHLDKDSNQITVYENGKALPFKSLYNNPVKGIFSKIKAHKKLTDPTIVWKKQPNTFSNGYAFINSLDEFLIQKEEAISTINKKDFSSKDNKYWESKLQTVWNNISQGKPLAFPTPTRKFSESYLNQAFLPKNSFELEKRDFWAQNLKLHFEPPKLEEFISEEAVHARLKFVKGEAFDKTAEDILDENYQSYEHNQKTHEEHIDEQVIKDICKRNSSTLTIDGKTPTGNSEQEMLNDIKTKLQNIKSFAKVQTLLTQSAFGGIEMKIRKKLDLLGMSDFKLSGTGKYILDNKERSVQVVGNKIKCEGYYEVSNGHPDLERFLPYAVLRATIYVDLDTNNAYEKWELDELLHETER